MVSSQPKGDGHRATLGGGAIASISGVVLLLVFVLQNTDDVKLDFLFSDFTWPLWLLTIVSALLGALVFVRDRDHAASQPTQRAPSRSTTVIRRYLRAGLVTSASHTRSRLRDAAQGHKGLVPH